MWGEVLRMRWSVSGEGKCVGVWGSMGGGVERGVGKCQLNVGAVKKFW